MKRFLKIYGIEQKLFFRSADVFVFNLCMPVATLVLIVMIAGGKAAGDSGMTYLQSAFASLISVGICCSAFMSIPIVMVDYRDKKILKQFYCSPVSPACLLGADTLCSAVMAAISALLVFGVAVVCFGYRMQGNVFYRPDDCKSLQNSQGNERSDQPCLLPNAVSFWCNDSLRDFS